jgi:hypothetical protein
VEDRVTRREWNDEDKAALTTEVGYTGPHQNFVGREWDWLDSHRPDLNIYCRGTGKRVGDAWYAPDGQVWYRNGPRQGQLGDWLTEGGNVPVMCPEHRMALLPGQYMKDAVAKRSCRKITVDCTNRHPVYHRP